MVQKKPDYLILCLFGVLLIFGLFVMGTTSFAISLGQYGNVWYLFLHQVAMVVAGIILGIVAFKLPIKFLKKIAPLLFLINLVLIFLVFIPGLGIEAKGAHRQIGLAGFSFQPSEFLKLSFILYLSAWLASKNQSKKERSAQLSLWPFLVIMGTLFAGLILQPDQTTLAIICLTGASMYLASKAPLWHFVVMAGVGGVGFFVATILEPYRLNRVLTMFKPHTDPMGKGLQLIQAKIAIGSGGILGIGTGFALGLSKQKFFLPESMTDSIFAIVAEELGFLGAGFLVFLFLFLCFLGLRIAKNKGQTFEGFLALGITVWITLQSLANIGGIVGVLPLGGIPLPFFSYGGSHIMTELIGVGLLLNISRYSKS
ncbi:MAG: FtsW/RodA/SpoVE family cell cycle protein [bacterium]